MLPAVKCSDCGFLALRHRVSRELMDAHYQFRDHGSLPADMNAPSDPVFGQPSIFEGVPICFVRKVHFGREIEAAYPGLWFPVDEHRLEAIQKDRKCDGFTPWQQGFSPKEHHEMLMAEQQRKWQEDRDARMAALEAQRFKQSQDNTILVGAMGLIATLLATILGFVLAKWGS